MFSSPSTELVLRGDVYSADDSQRRIFLILQTQAFTNWVFKWDQHFAFPKLKTPRQAHTFPIWPICGIMEIIWHNVKLCSWLTPHHLRSPSLSSTPLSSAHIWPDVPWRDTEAQGGCLRPSVRSLYWWRGNVFTGQWERYQQGQRTDLKTHLN